MSRTVKVGIFLVGGIVLFGVGLFLIGSRAQIFSHHYVIYTQFTDLSALQTGGKVRVSGMDAGEITGIDVPRGPSAQFRLELKVDKKFQPVIRKDSLASIETEGMVGNKFVNIKQGSEHSPECPPGCTLRGEEAVSTGELMREGSNLAKNMQSTVDDVRKRADQAIQNITSLTAHTDGLIVAAGPKITHTTSNVDAIVAGIRHGDGAAGKLLTNKAVGSNIERTIADTRQTSANIKQASGKVNTMISEIQETDLVDVHKTLENTQDMTQQLNQAVGTFLSPGNSNKNTAVALRETVHSAQQTTTNLADDTEAVKHNFFLRGFFKRRGFYNLETMTPSKYAASKFVKKPRVRVWIPAPGLFTVGRDGSQVLSNTGKQILDQSMSELTPYLPSNPMVVEGYSASGLPDQQYVASQQRAIAVRQYLESRFYLDTKRVGAIPLADHPPKGTGKTRWDGISLVLVVSER